MAQVKTLPGTVLKISRYRQPSSDAQGCSLALLSFLHSCNLFLHFHLCQFINQSPFVTCTWYSSIDTQTHQYNQIIRKTAFTEIIDC